MYVCLCTGVTDADIRAAIDDGAATAEAVMLSTRAGSRCGSCRTEVSEMVRARLAGESDVPRTRTCHRDDGKRHLDVHAPEGESAPRSAA